MKFVSGLPRRPALSLRRQSLRTQLMLWNILALALLLLILGAVIRYTVRSSLMAAVDRELVTRAHRANLPPGGPPPQGREGAEPPNGPGGPPPPEQGPPGGGPPENHGGPPPPRQGPEGRPSAGPPDPPEEAAAPERGVNTGEADSGRFLPQLFSLSGQPLGPLHTAVPWDQLALAQAAQRKEVFSTVQVDNAPVRVFSRPLPPRGPVRAVLQVPYSLVDVERDLAGVDRALLLLLPVALLGAGLGGAYLTDRVLRRVRTLTNAAGQIGAQRLSERLPILGNDEFSDLASTFNRLLGRLEEAFRQQEQLIAQQRRFTADASHELKTPLTIIQGNTSLMLEDPTLPGAWLQSIEDIDQAAESMSRLVQDLLLLARSQSGQLGRNRVRLPLYEVLTRATQRARRPEGAPISIDVSHPTLSVMGDENELLRLFTNLLENAVRHTPAEGQITVRAVLEGSQVVVTVADTGTGIAPEHLPHLGERFYRVDAARSRPEGGTGLGLAICKSIVEAHQGTISFASAVGHGTTVRITLPAP